KTLANFVGLSVCLGVGFSAGMLGSIAPALADDGIPPPPVLMDPTSAVNPVSIVSGAGIQVGEGTVLHPQIGIETGVVSNVFYQQDGPVAAGLLRFLAEVSTGSLPVQRLTVRTTGDDQDAATPQTSTAANAGDFQYSADLYASWDQYLSTNNNVNA